LSSKKSPFASAIVELRSTFDENQQKFSDRLGVALATLARWEISERYPSPRHIKEMWHLAHEQDRPKLAKIFADEFAIRAGYAISSGEAGFVIRQRMSDIRSDAAWLITQGELNPVAKARVWKIIGELDELRAVVKQLDMEPPVRTTGIIERKK
jgi:hypothetical protein